MKLKTSAAPVIQKLRKVGTGFTGTSFGHPRGVLKQGYIHVGWAECFL